MTNQFNCANFSALSYQIEEVVTHLDPHEALVEEIRKEEFGINVELNEDGRKLMNKQKERLGRSLDRLSKVRFYYGMHIFKLQRSKGALVRHNRQI